ncbi:hypothetical protein V2W45_1247290, partial [Cenococcum geophilum]
IKAYVRNAYGVNSYMFGVIELGVIGIKVTVIAITVSDLKLYILSNYNGAGTRRKECGYWHFRLHNADDKFLICDAAKTTFVVLSYFLAKYIAGLGFI